MQKSTATILGLMLVISFTIFGLLIKQALLEVKTYDRNVTVKGLLRLNFLRTLLFGQFNLQQPITILKIYIIKSMNRHNKLLVF